MLSGVNRGNNSAENTLYSGTVGAAMEAALQGLRAIALSQYMGPRTNDMPGGMFEPAVVHGTGVVRAPAGQGAVGRRRLPRCSTTSTSRPCPAVEVRGLKVAAQGFRRHTTFGVEPHMSPSGRKFLWIKGGPQHLPTLPGTDVAANLDGWISVTPMRCDLTAHDALDSLRSRLE